ncbi:hypothetical protein CC86DRAFT_68623 [Ophiobolus disseminans]|uniref:Uncharacterized protein n=1 Tax=Ophiobolus disseminans TaxID=1469910 RepID=A0A6A6ZRR9_9PLEO|nr:hypothetical protein CC86DRAFT_68623 [Ophiobolus disseminans]
MTVRVPAPRPPAHPEAARQICQEKHTLAPGIPNIRVPSRSLSILKMIYRK